MTLGFPFSATQEKLNTLYYLVPNAIILWALVGCALLLATRRLTFGFEGIVFGAFAGLAFALHSLLAAFPRMIMPLIPIALWFVFVTIGTLVVALSRADERNSRRILRSYPQLGDVEVDRPPRAVPRQHPVLQLPRPRPE